MLTEVPFRRVVEPGLEKPRHQQGTLIGDRGEVFPSTLFKYYSLEGLEKTISTNTFKWELPCNENDPFEALAMGWDKESIRKVLPTANAELGARSDAIFNSLDIQKSISYVAAYLSFSECANNILMWSHYAENGMGACVEIDVRHLLENISMDLVRVVYAEEVAGARRRVPPLNDDNNEDSQKLIRNFLSYKAKEWEYEHEWRLIDPPMAKCMAPRQLDNGSFILVSEIPAGAIKKMIFGYRMPVSTRLVLAKLIQRNHSLCTFAEITPDRERFELKVEPLEIETITSSPL